MSDMGAQNIVWLRDDKNVPMVDDKGNPIGKRCDGAVVVSMPVDAKAGAQRRVYNLDKSPMAAMRRKGTLTDRQFAAAEQFANDFYKARLYGAYATFDMNRVDSSKYDLSDHMIAARQRVGKALDSLGHIGQMVVWYMVGNHDDMKTVRWRLSQSVCGNANRNHIAGMLIVSLDTLVKHYRL